MEEAGAAADEPPLDVLDDVVVQPPTGEEPPTWKRERDDHLAAVRQLAGRVRAAAAPSDRAQPALVRLVRRARLADTADGSGQFGIYSAVSDEDLATLIAAQPRIARLWRAVETTGRQQDAAEVGVVAGFYGSSLAVPKKPAV